MPSSFRNACQNKEKNKIKKPKKRVNGYEDGSEIYLEVVVRVDERALTAVP